MEVVAEGTEVAGTRVVAAHTIITIAGTTPVLVLVLVTPQQWMPLLVLVCRQCEQHHTAEDVATPRTNLEEEEQEQEEAEERDGQRQQQQLLPLQRRQMHSSNASQPIWVQPPGKSISSKNRTNNRLKTTTDSENLRAPRRRREKRKPS